MIYVEIGELYHVNPQEVYETWDRLWVERILLKHQATREAAEERAERDAAVAEKAEAEKLAGRA